VTPKQRIRAEYLVEQCLAAWRSVISHRGQAEPVITFALDASTGRLAYYIDDPHNERPYSAAHLREKRENWRARGRNPTVHELLMLPEAQAVIALRRLREGKEAIDPEAAYLKPITGSRS